MLWALVHPLLVKPLALFTKVSLLVVKRTGFHKGVLLIFFSTQSLKDDVAFTYPIMEIHDYLLFGSPSAFFAHLMLI